MNPSNPAQLSAKEIFILAAGLENSAEREAVVNEHCSANPELLKQVQRLLAAADNGNAGSPLDAIVDAFGPEETHANPQSNGSEQLAFNLDQTTAMTSIKVGGQIGRYRLMEQLGEGGMGVVYVAEQVEPVRRKVALKVIKPGMDSKQVIARFEAERQALALMDHMNIARVLDGGTTEQGLPYFVMELVRGLPITEYCDQAKATTRDRLALFIAVCNAVHHAHQKGIIHRDIKPGNVLVTLHDGKPVVKVIDFGVAKALHQQLSQNTIYTGLNQVVGTPLYMSPEQLELSGLDIDTRTDIYSLGVLLYELLTGATPFDRERLLKSGFDEMRRIIREEEPPRPSQRITTLPKAELSTCAKKRGLDERTFSKSVQNELDWITLKALEKDRNRRYESSSAFGADVQRFLDDETVSACPPSLAYQLRKLIRRNRVAVLIVGATMLSLLIGLSLTAWQWSLAVVARKETANALQLVEQKADLANKRLGVAEYVIDDMYTQFAQDWLSQQSKLTNVQREYLEKAVTAFEQLAALDHTDTKPRIGAIIAKHRLGSILRELGSIEEAILALKQSVEMCNIALNSSPTDIDLRIRRVEAHITLSAIYRNKRNQPETLKNADAAYAELNEIENSGQLTELQRELISKGLSNCALRFATDDTRKSEARKAADSGLAIARQLRQEKPMDLVIKERLANCLSAKGQQCLWWGEQNEECAAAYQESIQLKLELIDERPDRQEALKSLPGSISNLRVVLNRLKRDEEADALILNNVEISRKIVSRFPDVPDHQSTLGEALRIAANYEMRRGNLSKAKDYRTQSRVILSEVVDRFPDERAARKSLVLVHLNLGLQYSEDSDYQLAVEIYEAANAYLVQFAKDFPSDTEMFVHHGTLLRNLATSYLQLGAHERAAVTGQQLIGLIGLPPNSESYYPSLYQQKRNELYLLVVVHQINSYCLDLINAENGVATAAISDSIAQGYATTSQELLNRVKTIVETWIQSQQDLTEIWGRLIAQIDAKDGWKEHGKGVDTLAEDASLQTDVVLLNGILDKFVDAKPLPDIWPSVMLTMASAKEFSLAPERQLDICKRGWQQARDAPLASQACAWTLFRNDEWQKCADILRTDPKLKSDENGFILAMALWHIGQREQAHETLNKTSAWMVANMELLETRRKAKPLVEQPNSETMYRLKQEAEQLIKPNDNP